MTLTKTAKVNSRTYLNTPAFVTEFFPQFPRGQHSTSIYCGPAWQNALIVAFLRVEALTVDAILYTMIAYLPRSESE